MYYNGSIFNAGLRLKKVFKIKRKFSLNFHTKQNSFYRFWKFHDMMKLIVRRCNIYHVFGLLANVYLWSD